MMRTSLMTDEQFVEHIKTHPVRGAKGDSTAQSTEKAQGEFTKQLQQTFQTNNVNQQNQLNFLNAKMQDMISNPKGYSPSTLAAMRAQANDAVAARTQQVQRSVNNTQMTRGGADALPSGVNAQVNAQIASSAAQAGNAAQQDITTQNADLENTNLWNATKAEEGVAGLENPEGMASSANNAASTVSGLSDAVTKANGPGVGSILGGIAGSALSGWAGGGFKKPGS